MMRMASLGRLTAGSGALFAALALLRLQTVTDLGLGLMQAAELGLHLGLMQDLLAVTLLCAGAVAVGSLLGGWWRPAWAVGGTVVWLVSLSGVVYFRAFGGLLEWWVVRYQYSDVPLVWDSAIEFGRFGLALVSGALLLTGLILVLGKRRERTRPSSVPARLRDRLRLLGVVLAILVLAAGIREAQRRLLAGSASGAPAVLRTQLVFDWLAAIRAPGGLGEDWSWRRESGLASVKRSRAGEAAAQEIAAVLAAYRDGGWRGGTASESAAGAASLPRLYRRFEVPRDEQLRLRAILGLPPAGPVNVVVLFVESLRSFELFHSELGPQVYPETKRLLQEHGLVFSQAYSSSFRAGQTVRGQFSTLCSMLPNMRGVAVYIGYPRLRVRCLAETLERHGYQTLWLSPFDPSHHNKYIFEKLHGTGLFFDEISFRARGVTQKVGKWGLADREFLEESLAILQVHHELPGPFFASLLTTTSHPPYSVPDGVALPADLSEQLEDNPQYLAYLSTMRYVDESLGAFFDGLFASEMAGSTLVVLVGDHSRGISPHLELSPVQQVEMRFRVPIALVTAGLEEPREIRHAVHQVDVAPTVAAVAGASDMVSWIGRSLLSGRGSPWVYEEGSLFHYREGETACYGLVGNQGAICLRTGDGVDPLFTTDPEPIEGSPAEAAFFTSVVEAASKAIESDLLVPAGL